MGMKEESFNKNNFVSIRQQYLRRTKERELEETKRLFYNLQPKTIICEAQAIKAENISKKREIAKGCSSERERKVNALALRAEEGRDYLR